jgi:hypothetical protein
MTPADQRATAGPSWLAVLWVVAAAVVLVATDQLVINRWILGPTTPVTLANCGVPPDLVATIVPMADAVRSTTDGGRQRCSWGTAGTATRDAVVNVQIEQPGFDRVRFTTPVRSAQDEFAAGKRAQLRVSRVFDVPGLADAAYGYTSAMLVSAATVTELVGPAIVTVNYAASPSTNALALGAAVEVARRVGQALRDQSAGGSS